MLERELRAVLIHGFITVIAKPVQGCLARVLNAIFSSQVYYLYFFLIFAHLWWIGVRVWLLRS